MKKIIAVFIFISLFISLPAIATDALPSWNDGASKNAIITFVEKVTTHGNPDFVPENERIAVFDNDGTLWAEKPMYVQFFFAVNRLKALASKHPEWKTEEPYASVLKGNYKSILKDGKPAIQKIIMSTHAGMTTEEFEKIVKDWIATAKNPATNQLFTNMVYQPMLELLNYLRANGFKTFIVTGGGIEFVRPWSEKVYGIPPENIVGSSIKTKYEIINGKPVLMRLAEINFIDDKSGKPVGINSHIGMRPIAAFGNSDGDQQMLEWTQGGKGLKLMMLVHHDDAKREWAYGPNSKVGTFSDALMQEAKKNGWVIISIKNDWGRVFPFKKSNN